MSWTLTQPNIRSQAHGSIKSMRFFYFRRKEENDAKANRLSQGQANSPISALHGYTRNRVLSRDRQPPIHRLRFCCIPKCRRRDRTAQHHREWCRSKTMARVYCTRKLCNFEWILRFILQYLPAFRFFKYYICGKVVSVALLTSPGLSISEKPIKIIFSNFILFFS